MAIWAILVGVLLSMGLRSYSAGQLTALFSQPGFWVPLSLLAIMLGTLVLVRHRYRRVHITLSGDRLSVRPGWLRRTLSGQRGSQVSLSEARQIRDLPSLAGRALLVQGPDNAHAGNAPTGGAPTGDAHAGDSSAGNAHAHDAHGAHDAHANDAQADDAPLLVPLAHPRAAEVASRLLELAPTSSWQGEARLFATRVIDGPPSEGAPGWDGGLQALGLWHLGARRAWPALFARPHDPDAARALWALEKHRLPTAHRLRLALSLARLQPEDPDYRLEVARLGLAMRLHPLAKEALDDLVSRPEPLPLAVHWRTCLRERRAVPAPGSRATFGIEVNLPHHRLEGDTLVVQERFRVELRWFVAYAFVPGFWGPPRSFELVDLWGARHILRGDAQTWAADLTRAAPHLTELHEVGWIWPPVTGRLAALDRASRRRAST